MSGAFERMKEAWERLVAADEAPIEEAAEAAGLSVTTVRRLRESRAYAEAAVGGAQPLRPRERQAG